MISYQTSINFIIGLIFNQSYDSERAWNAPNHIRDRLNTKEIDLYDIQDMGLTNLQQLIAKKPSLHRFHRTISEYLYYSIASILHEFNGDPRNIWQVKDYKTIKKNLMTLHGIGEHKAKQGLIILSRLDTNIVIPDSYYNYILETCSNVLYNLENNIAQIIFVKE